MYRALSLLPCLALLLPSLAEAQCPDGATFCAEIEVEGSVSIGGRRNPPPPPPAEVEVEVEVEEAPPAPEVHVQQAPPRRRGRIVVVRPAPPPPPPQQVVVTPAPRQTTVTVETTQQHRPVRVRPQQRWNRKFALTVRGGGILSEQLQMGGLQVGARFRASRIFGVELGLGTYVGTDYNGDDRREHPVTFDFMFFFPKASRFQVYTLIGGGFSFANVDTDPFDPTFSGFDRRYAYIGGQMGLGVEWRISPFFAISTDLRGFLRTRIDPDRDGINAEFVDLSSGRTTNTSAGVLGTFGMHFYF